MLLSPPCLAKPYMTSFRNAKFVFIFMFILFLYGTMCINVSPTPSPTILRSEPIVKKLQIELMTIFTLSYLCICLITVIVLNIELNCRYLSFSTRLNTLPVSTKVSRNENLYFCLLFTSYLLIFEFYFIVFLPCEFWKAYLDTRNIKNKSLAFLRLSYGKIASITQGACYRLIYFVI